MSTTRRLAVKTPVISVGDEVLNLIIGGRPCTLTTADTEAFRRLAVALQASPGVVLEIEENPKWTAPEDQQ
jgi:hypothetical protein